MSASINNNNKSNNDHIQTGNVTGNGIIIGKNIHVDGNIIVNLSDKAESLDCNLKIVLTQTTYLKNIRVQIKILRIGKWASHSSYRRLMTTLNLEGTLWMKKRRKLKLIISYCSVGEMGTSKSTIWMNYLRIL